MFKCFKLKSVLTVVLLAVVLGGCLMGMYYNADAVAVANNKSLRKVPIYQVDRDDKQIAISFDAAWGADKTLKILEILKKYDVTATFFLVGFWIDKFPEEVKAIAESGCEIGNHSNNHYNMPKLSAEEIDKELQYVNTRVNELTGLTPKVFRPPFGDYSNLLIDRVEANGMKTIQWSVDSLDWKGISASEITSRVTKGISSGGIVLFHNNSDNILEALPLVLSNFINNGYKLVTMSELIYTENYYIDSNGIQHINS